MQLRTSRPMCTITNPLERAPTLSVTGKERKEFCRAKHQHVETSLDLLLLLLSQLTAQSLKRGGRLERSERPKEDWRPKRAGVPKVKCRV